MDKFQNKYRIQSARAQWWDYSNAGAYFITICTAGREHYFGEIADGKMTLSNIGAIADVLWHEIKNHAKNVELGEFCVMPNHIHGILILTENITTEQTPPPLPLPQISQSKNQQMAAISPKTHTVSAIIRSYKSAVSNHVHRLGYDFVWQERFHDHIIREDAEDKRIANYIVNNPANWNEDKFYTE
jgi:REP element-mobilizing transposase RayT